MFEKSGDRFILRIYWNNWTI